MGFIKKTVGGLLGMGSNGANFHAQAAPIVNPVNMGQIGNAYDQSMSGINQQQSFLNALQAQNGLGNQANVFGQQQDLANQLQGVANGTGPNLAMAQLNNTTGQNVANQAALMAGQRGAGQNAGLLARQAAMQGGNLQQQAVGQGAALQAQQQLAAMQALQGQQNMMGNLANQQVSNQAGALQNLNQFQQGEQGQLLNAAGNFNQAQVGSTSSQNSANSGVAGINAKGGREMINGALGGIGAAFMAGGGMVPSSGARSMVGQHFACGGAVNYAGGAMVPGKAQISGDSLKNDTVPAMLSPGEVVIPRHIMQSDNPAKMASKFVEAIIAKQGMRRK